MESRKFTKVLKITAKNFSTCQRNCSC